MKKLAATFALVTILTFSAFAGDVPIGGRSTATPTTTTEQISTLKTILVEIGSFILPGIF